MYAGMGFLPETCRISNSVINILTIAVIEFIEEEFGIY